MVSDLSNSLLSSVIVHFHPAATFARAASFLAQVVSLAAGSFLAMVGSRPQAFRKASTPARLQSR
jgi:hypothetical protein